MRQQWRPITRVAFRFSVLYLGLFALATQISGSLFLPGSSFRGLGAFWPMRNITAWVAARVFGITKPPVYTVIDGETVFFWVQTFWLLVVAAGGTLLWSAIARQRTEYETLHKWCRLFFRFGLAAQMFEYGMTKVIPVQFAPPSLSALVTPAGDLSLNTLLWTSIGASTAYQIFTGCVEILGGLLLLIPRTTMLGAMISLAAVVHVFVLNMTYDIGLKLVTFHLILFALFLLAPDFRRLANFFILDRPAGPSTEPPLFETPGANRNALVAQILWGGLLLGAYFFINWSYWHAAGPGSPKSPLYGIWDVQQLSIDGLIRDPYSSDYDRRWRRVIFDSPDVVTFQRTDDSFARYGVFIDVYNKTITLTKGSSKTWKASFAFERPVPELLILDGQMDGQAVRLQVRRVEFDTFRLLNSGFRWVRPPDP